MILAFLLAVAAKLAPPDPRDTEIAALKAEVDDLKGERDRWIDRALRSERELIDRQSAQRMSREIGDTLLGRQQQLPMPQPGEFVEVSPGYFQSMQALQQQWYAQHALALQQNTLAQQGWGPLDSPTNPAHWCNCVPARHDMFLRGPVT